MTLVEMQNSRLLPITNIINLIFTTDLYWDNFKVHKIVAGTFFNSKTSSVPHFLGWWNTVLRGLANKITIELLKTPMTKCMYITWSTLALFINC